ncbi:hypothetical protein [Thermococcus sp.]|uniref:hypothetical protein n=1 Tax=Thermococcus sp. TaxID=35749 RepID=UPI0026176EB5|nr:hypothetical protein [Thermococcus sp.]
MGALHAFSTAFSLVSGEKKAYAVILIAVLILIPLGTALGLSSDEGQVFKETRMGNVTFEEYGAKELSNTLVENLRNLLIYSLIALVLFSSIQYGVTKAYILFSRGEEYSMGELLLEGLKHFPGVIVVNILGYLSLMLLSAIPIGMVITGAVVGEKGLVLLLLGVALIIAIIPFGIAFSAILVPAYIEEGNVGAFLTALTLALRNFLSSIGLGVLLLLLLLGVSVVLAPILLLAYLAMPGSTALASVVIAPFDAFIVAFIWASGVVFYTDLKGKEREKEFLY